MQACRSAVLASTCCSLHYRSVSCSACSLGSSSASWPRYSLRSALELHAYPEQATILEVYGVAILCGIGFTISLFIGLLAFDDPSHVAMTKLAVLAGSVLSALAGVAVMMLPNNSSEPITSFRRQRDAPSKTASSGPSLR